MGDRVLAAAAADQQDVGAVGLGDPLHQSKCSGRASGNGRLEFSLVSIRPTLLTLRHGPFGPGMTPMANHQPRPHRPMARANDGFRAATDGDPSIGDLADSQILKSAARTIRLGGRGVAGIIFCDEQAASPSSRPPDTLKTILLAARSFKRSA